MGKIVLCCVMSLYWATSHADTPLSSYENTQGSKVYARLSKQQGKWRIVETGKIPGPADGEGIDISLNDLAPARLDLDRMSVKISCVPLGSCIEERTHGDFKYGTRDEAIQALVSPWAGPFSKAEVNIGWTAFNNVMALVISAGLKLGININTYTFDWHAYREALAEAVEYAGLTAQCRASLVEGGVCSGVQVLKPSNEDIIEG